MEKCRKPKTSAAPPEPACAESAEAISIDGLHVLEDFVTCCEEQSILNEVCHNDAPWDTNLSRRVQVPTVLCISLSIILVFLSILDSALTTTL